MRNKRLSLWIGGIVVLVLLAGGGIAWAVAGGSDDTPEQPPAAAPSSAPAAPATPAPSPGADIKGPLDILLIGVDTRVSVPAWQPHADTVMLLHVERDLKSAYLYSLPRDLRVKMPKFPKARFAGGTHKLTEAMSRGSRVTKSVEANVGNGYELLAQTVRGYTGLKQIQAGAILNFGGLDKLTDAVGGIELVIDQKVESIHRRPDGTMRTLKPGGGDYTGPQAVYLPGKRRLVGWQAIDYARQRYGLPNGDYDRTRHQRQLVKALVTKAFSQGITEDATKTQNVISALGDTLEYVGGRSPLEYAYALRNLTADKITVVNLTGDGVNGNSGYIGERLTPESKGFVDAVAKGQARQYLATHPRLLAKN